MRARSLSLLVVCVSHFMRFGALGVVSLMWLLVSAVAASAETSPSVRVVTPKAQMLTRPAPGADLVMTVAQGTVLDVMDNDGGWYWVSLPPDQKGTRRRGWIQARDVEAVAVDLSAEVRELTEMVQQLQQQLNKQSTTSTPTERSGNLPGFAPIPPPAPSQQPQKAARREEQDRPNGAVPKQAPNPAAVAQTSSASAPIATTSPVAKPAEVNDVSAGRPQGVWFNAGLGIGAAGCEYYCEGRANGLSGGLSLGGRISDRVLLGVGTSGWANTVDGVSVSVSTVDARLRFYPARKSGFFLTGGAGLGRIGVAGVSEFGVGVILGVGWDIPVARNVSLTPVYNGFGVNSSFVGANVGQLGIGVTIH